MAGSADSGYRYWPALDGLRCLAVAIVLFTHTLPGYVPRAAIGVDLFFVLSGFLITSILLDEFDRTGRIALGKFYARRLTRLAPALLLMLAVTVAMGPQITGVPADKLHRMALFAATYTMNWHRAFWPGYGSIFGHTWSLAVEEQFYLVWPLLLLLSMTLLRRRGALLATIGLIVIVICWRAWLVGQGATISRISNGFDTRADPLLIGCALALLKQRGMLERAAKMLAPLLIIGILGLTQVSSPDPAWRLWRPAVAGVFSAGMILLLTSPQPNWVKSLFSLPPAMWLGRISYGIYLWHYVVIPTISLNYGASRLTLLAGGIATVAIAAASYYAMERPLLRWVRGSHVGRAEPINRPAEESSAPPG